MAWGESDPVVGPSQRGSRPAATWGASDPVSDEGTRDKPFDLTGGQPRSSIPRGSYYRDPQGNIRRNVNGDRGNPIVQRRSSAGGDVARATGAGVMQGGDQVLGLLGDVRTQFGRLTGGGALDTVRRSNNPLLANLADAAIGAQELTSQVGQAFSPSLLASRLAPTSQRLSTERQAAVGRDYVPQTEAGRVGRSIGRMAPNALIPSSVPARIANVVLPGVGGEAARYAAERGGLGPQGQAVAEMAGQMAGGVAAGVRIRPQSGVRPAPQQPPADKSVPVVERLQGETRAAYQAADQAGVRYTPEAFSSMVDSVVADAGSANLSGIRHPKAADMIAELQKMRDAGYSPTLTEMDQLRQVIRRDVASATDPAEAFFGSRMIQQLDGFIASAGPDAVLSGSAQDAASLITGARQANTRLRKVETVTDAVDSATMRAGSTGSGGNANNAIRQNLRRVLETANNLTPQESAAIREIVMGSPTQNALRQVGKLSPSGNGLMAAGNLAAAASYGPLGAIPGTVGLFAKWGADAMTKQKVSSLIDLMAGGGERGAMATQQLSAMAARDPVLKQIVDAVSARLASSNPAPVALPAAMGATGLSASMADQGQ